MSSNQQDPIVIIGSGLAGYNVAREFRKLDTGTPLVIISADNGEFYSKPMLSNALAKNKSAGELPMANAEKMATDLDATILTRTRVEKIDPENKQIDLSNKASLGYNRLVLALGASPVTVAMQGNATNRILHVNDLDSYADFRNALEGRKKVSIIGAGLIGCEFANDLVNAGHEVSIIHLAELPLNRLLPEAAGKFLKTALTATGINWYTGQQVKAIDHNGELFQLELENGHIIDTDVVLSAVGLQANTSLAKAAGLKVNKAIEVNRFLETSHEGIYALGDCAEVEGLFLPYVMPLMNAARVLAKNLSLETSVEKSDEKVALSYPAMPVIVKTPVCPVVASIPCHEIQGEWIINEDEQGVHARYVDKEGKLQGFALVGKAVEDKLKLTKELPVILN